MFVDSFFFFAKNLASFTYLQFGSGLSLKKHIVIHTLFNTLLLCLIVISFCFFFHTRKFNRYYVSLIIFQQILEPVIKNVCFIAFIDTNHKRVFWQQYLNRQLNNILIRDKNLPYDAILTNNRIMREGRIKGPQEYSIRR